MIASSPFLRRVLALDAVASGATGLLLALGGELLAGLTGVSAQLAQPLGLFLIGYAAVVAWLASRPVLPGAAVWAVIALNGAWAIESIVSLVGTCSRRRSEWRSSSRRRWRSSASPSSK